MKMIAEYLEHAIRFERMAADESDPRLKADFEKQAAAYRKLAEQRAKKQGLQFPPPPKMSTPGDGSAPENRGRLGLRG